VKTLFPPKTIQRELHRSNIHGRAETAKPLITEHNGKRRKIWCDDYEICKSYEWKYIIRSDESFFMLFPASGRVYVRRTPKKTYNPECLVPIVKHGARSVMIWAAISWYSVGPIISLIGRITASDYVDIVGDQVLHPMVRRLFPKNVAFSQDDVSPIHCQKCSVLGCEHEDTFQHLTRPAQSPDLTLRRLMSYIYGAPILDVSRSHTTTQHSR